MVADGAGDPRGVRVPTDARVAPQHGHVVRPRRIHMAPCPPIPLPIIAVRDMVRVEGTGVTARCQSCGYGAAG